MRSLRNFLKKIVFCVLVAFFFCEYFVYHLSISRCSWPTYRDKGSFTNGKFIDESQTVRVMILSDPHLLGSQHGHWFDKLRREWQMKRSFQAAMSYLRPEAVVVLGDIFDEGMICSDQEWDFHVLRFWDIFAHPDDVMFYVTPGNHDIGFHERLTYKSRLSDRFKRDFNVSGVSLLHFKGNSFVLVNSMAFEQDGCSLCIQAEEELFNIAEKLACLRIEKTELKEECKSLPSMSKPILFQHFPLYRSSEVNCSGKDAPPVEIRTERNRGGWEVLSKSASELLLSTIQPKLIFSGHTHHSCHIAHHNDIHEFSLPSFSWRNRNDPSFYMALFNPNAYSLQQCFLPEESTVILAYIFGFFTIVCIVLWTFCPKYYYAQLYKVRIFQKKRVMKDL